MTIAESRGAGAPDVVVLTLRGRLDSTTADTFAGCMAAGMEKGERAFVLNLAGVDYINSIGLRSLVSASKALVALQGRMALCELTPHVQQVFGTVGFNSLFRITATEAEACALVGGGAPGL